MNTRAINAAAGVINAAMQQGKQLPASLAIALDSAGLLNSPEHAAEFERLRSASADGRSADEDPIRYALTDKADGVTADEDVTPQVLKLRSLLAGQRADVEATHEGPERHTYRLGRDLPQAGGAL
jgi:hypothetical protein